MSNVNSMKMTTAYRTFSLSALRSLAGCALALFTVTMLTSPAQAAFHLWTIREVYTDVSGNLQFVELVDNSGFQNFVNGQQIQVSNVGATQTHSFTVPGGSLSGNTFGHALLFGTAGLAAAGGPTPDYIIPNNFLFAAGGTLNVWSVGSSGPYSALPTDGSNSRTWTGGDALNSPQNYASQTGQVSVPEPATWTFFAAGFTCLSFVMRRRSH